jgi:hypothetical protein
VHHGHNAAQKRWERQQERRRRKRQEHPSEEGGTAPGAGADGTPGDALSGGDAPLLGGPLRGAAGTRGTTRTGTTCRHPRAPNRTRCPLAGTNHSGGALRLLQGGGDALRPRSARRASPYVPHRSAHGGRQNRLGTRLRHRRPRNRAARRAGYHLRHRLGEQGLRRRRRDEARGGGQARPRPSRDGLPAGLRHAFPRGQGSHGGHAPGPFLGLPRLHLPGRLHLPRPSLLSGGRAGLAGTEPPQARPGVHARVLQRRFHPLRACPSGRDGRLLSGVRGPGDLCSPGHDAQQLSPGTASRGKLCQGISRRRRPSSPGIHQTLRERRHPLHRGGPGELSSP